MKIEEEKCEKNILFCAYLPLTKGFQPYTTVFCRGAKFQLSRGIQYIAYFYFAELRKLYINTE